jgi:hypothetical protein
MTSRDYIWKAAQRDLKLQALPILNRSQVVINVQELSTQERAQILYNHLKLGDQPIAFRTAVKPHLPEIAERQDFLPETARRLGSKFFAGRLSTSREAILAFFERPQNFLLETIINLAPDCRAAIAVVFMNGGKIRSPVPLPDLDPASLAFGVGSGAAREQLEALNGSLLLLAQDETGPFWTYKHPTVSDAFARYVAGSPELVEIYLRGARPDSIIYEVVCAGASVYGAPVIVPDTLHPLLAERILGLPRHVLATFLSYRSNRNFSRLILERRSDILRGLQHFYPPIKDDLDASLVATLHEQRLLPEEIRLNFVRDLRSAAVDAADASFLDRETLQEVLTEEERDSILDEVKIEVLDRIPDHIRGLQSAWDKDIPPDDYFDEFKRSIKLFVNALSYDETLLRTTDDEISRAVALMNEEYEPSSSTSAPTASSTPRSAALTNLFRDVDE